MKIHLFILLIFISLGFISSMGILVSGCKDIVVVQPATAGEYNLLLKVRDPSRPNYQVLTIIPKGYSYDFHHPWTGKSMNFEVNHAMIGVASVGDTIPNIAKNGMCMTDAGLAFGDADTLSNWKNPLPTGWDDFDWIRYAAQSADNEHKAVEMLTKDVVDTLHAPSVPENLFVVGPNKGYVIEADAFHYTITEVTDHVVMSNYVKNLWGNSLFYRLIAPSFNSTFQGIVEKGRTIRLGKGCLYGIKLLDVTNEYIDVKQAPFQLYKGNIKGLQFGFSNHTRIYLDEIKNVGFYRVGFLSGDNTKAMISMCYEYKEWEDELDKIIQSHYGKIDSFHLMNWSRLHSSDLQGLRGMCDEDEAFLYEGAMIYKIPHNHFSVLSQGWFSANHPCSSIYVPVHICVTDIYDPYENSIAAQQSHTLLNRYGHGYFSEIFSNTEQVFINELSYLEPTIYTLLDDNISGFLTQVDVSMQNQAFLTQQLWINLSELSDEYSCIENCKDIWEKDYENSLKNMQLFLIKYNDYDKFKDVCNIIINMSISIVKTRLQLSEYIQSNAEESHQCYNDALIVFQQGEIMQAFDLLLESYHLSNSFLIGHQAPNLHPQSQYDQMINQQIPILMLI